MKFVSKNKASFQGDLMIISCDEIPKNAKKIQPTGDYHIVAHSDTGHHHVIAAQQARVFAAAVTAMAIYVEVQKQALLEHLRPYDPHESLCLPPGNYKFLRQREGTPQGWRQVAD